VFISLSHTSGILSNIDISLVMTLGLLFFIQFVDGLVFIVSTSVSKNILD
jgi:hypothetical protein